MIAKPDYDYLSQFLVQRSGLALGTGKEYLLEARLIPLAQSFGLAGIDELVRELKQRPQPRLISATVEAMTTNETLFFRDKTPFEELRERLLPPILAARQGTRKLRIWCAAASTGQEPYSLAMLLRDNFPELQTWSVEIIGTDISSAALNRAKEGVYSQFEVQRGLPIQTLMKHFEQVPQGWQVKADIRQMIQYRSLNLLESFTILGTFDVIFCRNVLIYFENPVKKQILDRMCQLLRPDGYLLLGAAETVMGVTETFERYRECRAAVYTPRVKVAA